MISRRALLAGAAGAATAAPREAIPTSPFGKTGRTLPILACGGSALVEKWAPSYGVPALSLEKRVAMIRHAYDRGVRYFDTSRNYQESEYIMGLALQDVRREIYLASKVGVGPKGIIGRQDVRASIEESLKMLKTDRLDCIQIHGPVFEYMGHARAMEIYEELDKMRGEKLFRWIGVTGHTAFEIMYRLIDARIFDQVLLAYGYFPKGMDTILSHANLQWRELCLARARELGMGVLAMKVLGSFVLGHNASQIVPDFGESRLKAMRQAALRWALRDPKPPTLLVGISKETDVDENIRTLAGDRTFTTEDHKLLAEFSARALHSPAVEKLKTT